ncbi:hypothetical protein Tco_0518696, partial [Tanacetum coccineum]
SGLIDPLLDVFHHLDIDGLSGKRNGMAYMEVSCGGYLEDAAERNSIAYVYYSSLA